ncbi:MAG: recombinase family protein, partial [Bacteroidales bacterium]|nr:recombinase family protein [Bacteroidales bacterium]
MALKNELSKEEFVAIFENSKSKSFAEENFINLAANNLKKYNLPTKADEEWKHTSIRKILQHKYFIGENLDLDKNQVNLFTIPGLNAYRLVFINGFYSKQFSDEILNNKGLIIKNIADAKKSNPELINKYFENTDISSENFFTSVNTAFSFDGSFISIPNNLALD